MATAHVITKCDLIEVNCSNFDLCFIKRVHSYYTLLILPNDKLNVKLTLSFYLNLVDASIALKLKTHQHWLSMHFNWYCFVDYLFNVKNPAHVDPNLHLIQHPIKIHWINHLLTIATTPPTILKDFTKYLTALVRSVFIHYPPPLTNYPNCY